MPPKRSAEPETPAVSEPASKKQTPEPSSKNGNNSNNNNTTNGNGQQQTKMPASVLQRRREGRQRQKENIQNILDEAGIRKTDQENNFKFSSIPIIQLINQKNYFTDYLKKDEQLRMVRKVKDKATEQKQAKKQADVERKQASQDILTKLKNGNGHGHGHGFGSSTSLSGMASSGTSVNPSNYNSVNNSEFEDDDADEMDPADRQTIVLHPGSMNIRVGLSTDVDPKSVLNVISHRLTETTPRQQYTKTVDPAREPVDSEDGKRVKLSDPAYAQGKKVITSSFKERMRYYKRRILPNSNETCLNFNLKTQPELIQDHDDIHKVEFLNSESEQLKRKKYVVGEQVLRLEDPDNWLIRSPFMNGNFNDLDQSYNSKHEVLGDIELILSHILKKEFDISTKKQVGNYNCVLVVSNLYDKNYVETMIDFLLKVMGFHQISIIQEGLAATFGSGVSSGCIVDIGACSTKICCLEEGAILPNSQVELSYGANDVTRFLVKNLVNQQFPYTEFNLNDLNDWKMANALKEQIITFNDANVAIQLFKFECRKPGVPSKKYEFKSFDDVMVSPMALFYPHVFVDQQLDEHAKSILLGKISPNKPIRDKRLTEN
ncbi:unnamed protein product [Ambrosiozyma monospora]|uniref:Unnamed protein product n=1 Tax=Ambrosiozyma monospora TaxID=43982 RepID=A0ACB5SYD6_AMBMO|nr:unnamed protein product [Ambrosiozyma monospora]